MLCSIQNNEVTLYNVELNRNRLKAIRKKIIKKHGDEKVKKAMTDQEFQDFIFSRSFNWISEFIIVNLEKIHDGDYVIFETVNCPPLAIIIDEILKGNEESIKKLSLFQEYSEVTPQLSLEKYEEQYSYSLDNNSWLYIDKVLENIKLIPVYKDNFSDVFDLIEKLEKNGDYIIKNKALTIKDSLIPSELSVYMDVDKQKKIGTI